MPSKNGRDISEMGTVGKSIFALRINKLGTMA